MSVPNLIRDEYEKAREHIEGHWSCCRGHTIALQVPALLEALVDEQATHAKTCDNFESHMETCAEENGRTRALIHAARAAAQRLLEQEQKHSGSGRDGHLNEDDLVPLLDALGVVYIDEPDPTVIYAPSLSGPMSGLVTPPRCRQGHLLSVCECWRNNRTEERG